VAKQDVVTKFSLVDGISAGVKKIGESLKDLGSIVGKLTLAGAAVGAAIAAVSAVSLAGPIREAVSLEAAMSRAAAATGATAEQMDLLEQAAEDASRATGFSAEEAAQTLEQLGRAGLNAAESAGALVPALNLAKAAAVSTSEAANILADTLDQFGLAGDQAGTVADKLAAGAKNAGTSLGQLTAGLTAVAPQARELGLSLDTTVAALGLLAKQGQEGGKAASGLREIFASLQDPSSKFREELAKIGITSTDFTTVLQQLGTKGEAGQKAIQSLGTKGTAALQALLREGGGALVAFQTTIEDANGEVSELAKIFDDNVAGSFKRFQSAFGLLRKDLVEPLLDPIQRELEALTVKINDFVKSEDFAKIKAAIKDAFEGGIEFVKNFIAEFDFDAAVTSVTNFVRDTGKQLKEAGEAAKQIASLVKGAIDLVRLAANGINVAADAGSVAGARIAQTLLDKLPPVTQGIRDLQKGARDVRIALEDELGKSIDNLNVKLGELTDAEQESAQGAGGSAAAQREVADITLQRVDAIGDLLPKIEQQLAKERELADSTKRESAALKERARLDAEAEARSKQELIDLKKLSDSTAEYHERATSGATSYREAQDRNVDGFTAQQQAALDQINANQQLSDSQKEIARDTVALESGYTKAGTAAVAASDQAEAASEKLGSASIALAGILQAIYNSFAAISQAAADLWVENQKSAAKGEASIRLFLESVQRAEQATRRAVDQQIASAKGLTATLNALDGQSEQSAAILSRMFAGASANAEAFASALENRVAQGFELLDQQTLSGLTSAIRRAGQELRQIEERALAAKDALRGIGDSLQDELDRLAGNDEAIQQRRFESELARIKELAKQGGAAALEQAARAERLLRERHAAEMARIRAEGDERRRQDRETSTQRRDLAAAESAATAEPTAPAAPQQPNNSAFLNRDPRPINLTLNLGTFMGDPKEVANFLGRAMRDELGRLGFLGG
jgi:TP901 family phage tail tape measure protein